MQFSEFIDATKRGNVIPVYDIFMADLLTPVSAFLRLQALSNEIFLFESVEGGEKTARFSFLGCKPFSTITFSDHKLAISSAQGTTTEAGNIFEYLNRQFSKYKMAPVQGLPRFTGGAVGYFSYETIRYYEDVPLAPANEPSLPEAVVMLFDTVLAFDHLRQQIFIVKNVMLTDKGDADYRAVFDDAKACIDEVREALSTDLPASQANGGRNGGIEANFEQPAFEAAVLKAKEYIKAGDIFQVVLSQKFQKEISVPPFDIYRALRVVNPSPYLYFVKQGDTAIIGSSPELLVRVEDGQVEVRPIAGTRPRGKDSDEDDRLRQELLADKKELAEHVMLVDLGRNDVGRVCAHGSVEVDEFMIVEKYSHVMHIVSNVRGQLRPELTALDALQACFPAGTVSGAPKIRAMEIIQELEPEQRGVYAGALGYLDFSGNLDTCIAIRTIITKGQTAYFQAGAGIVADSDPTREFEETLHKSAALRTAIDFAERGLK